MCFFNPPAAPAPIPEKQAAKSPQDPSGVAQADLQRRMGLASTILADIGGKAASTTAGTSSLGGKTTLGA